MPGKFSRPALAIVVALLSALPAHADSTGATDGGDRLKSILDAQPDDVKARYPARNPAATLSFCDVNEGEMVIETLPGAGWYSRIVHPYIGTSGRLIGAFYPMSLFERFGWDDERLNRALDRDKSWPGKVTTNPVGDGAPIETYTMTDMPARYDGAVDTVLFIRSLHNLNRFGDETGYLADTLGEAYRALKPGGIACVVQHEAAEDTPDDWANGQNGYLKRSRVVAAFEAAGFKLAASSDINANPKDRPKETDSVWRLPPVLRGTEPDTDARRAVEAIGESNRMTLKFVKPAG